MIPAAVVLLANLGMSLLSTQPLSMLKHSGIGMVVVWSLSAAVPGANIFQTASRFIELFFILTMGLNLCCTGMELFYLYYICVTQACHLSCHRFQDLG
jgi:hypothetical protein